MRKSENNGNKKPGKKNILIISILLLVILAFGGFLLYKNYISKNDIVSLGTEVLNKIEEKGIDKKDEERGRYIALNNELCFTNDSFYKLLEKDGIDVKVKEISSEIKEFLKNIEEIIK